LEFDLMASSGECTATALSDGRFASRSFNTPQLRRGYESIEEAEFLTQAPRVAREAVEKVQAPAVAAGAYDLVLDPEHLSLTMHESCGHPSELDRALGYEANYAGTSFLTTDKLGTFRYGSPQVTLVADNTEPETLAATGYDDDGVACQKWDIVREGIFTGYCTNREVAPKIGAARSRGSNRADSWGTVPIVRIANIGLEPGQATVDQLIADVRRGIYIEGHGSYSIDQRPLQFSVWRRCLLADRERPAHSHAARCDLSRHHAGVLEQLRRRGRPVASATVWVYYLWQRPAGASGLDDSCGVACALPQHSGHSRRGTIMTATSAKPWPKMTSREEFQFIAEQVLKCSAADHTLVALHDQDGGTARFANNQIIQNVNARRGSLVVTVAFDTRQGTATTTDFTAGALRETVKRAEAIARLSPKIRSTCRRPGRKSTIPVRRRAMKL
jgi:predicted Zn-dependent protease